MNFYDASVGSYLQILSATAGVLDKGAAFAEENSLDTQELVMSRLRDDMMPLHFQVVSVCHHSLGAVRGMQAGRFSPPSFELDKSYSELQQLVAQARSELDALDAAEVNALADGSMVFALGEREMPFSNQNFLQSFSLPNFYFHATTTYDLLRMKGVSLSKIDFLGALKVG